MLKFAGYFFVLLALIGIILPVFPTTPFLIVAAMCFAKSSPELHAKLLNHKLFGPIIHDWEKNRCISFKVKLIAISSVILFTGSSVLWLTKGLWLKTAGILVILIAIAIILKIPTCCNDNDCRHKDPEAL